MKTYVLQGRLLLGSSVAAGGGGCDELQGFISTYLFPLVLEYSIISIGTCVTVMHSGIGQANASGEITQGFKNLIKVSRILRN